MQNLINMAKEKQPLICCLCDTEIQPHPLSGWAYGNNPDPLGKKATDRCCDECNATKVLPARLGAFINHSK